MAPGVLDRVAAVFSSRNCVRSRNDASDQTTLRKAPLMPTVRALTICSRDCVASLSVVDTCADAGATAATASEKSPAAAKEAPLFRNDLAELMDFVSSPTPVAGEMRGQHSLQVNARRAGRARR